MGTILDTIVSERRLAVREAKQKRRLSELERLVSERPRPHSLASAFLTCAEARALPTEEGPPHRVIAEVKRASPSKGIIRQDFKPGEIAASYERHGAQAISILTEEKHFHGSLDYLKEIAGKVAVPLLRKDFFVDPYQVIEARAFGASAILIIAACTERSLAGDLRAAAREFSLDVLAEVHTEGELEEVLAWGDNSLVGINNRNLHTFEITIQTTLDLLPRIPESRQVIAESGLGSRKDLDTLREAGAGGFLIGESLMRAPDPGAKLAEVAGLPPPTEREDQES